MNHVFQHQKVSDFLKTELDSKKNFNPSYSLRAFARDLHLAASTLSEVISGKKGISKVVAEKIARRLSLGKEEKKYFLLLADLDGKKTPKKVDKIRDAIIAFRDKKILTLDMFQLISEWHHFSVLEGLKNKIFRQNTQMLANLLNISDEQLRQSLQILKKLALIDENNVPTRTRISTPQDLPSVGIRSHHKSILKKAEMALDTQTVDERDFQSSHMIFSKENIPKVKERIRNFQEDLIQEYGVTQNNKQDIYCLAIQFFNLTNGTTEEVV